MISQITSFAQRDNLTSRALIAAIIPISFVVVLVFVRSHVGPFWHWYLSDPTYFYLLDGINLLNGDTPGHIYHPGITVHAFNAVILGLGNLHSTGNIQDLVLADPEKYLKLLSNLAIILSASAIFLIGIIGRSAFGSWLPSITCQLSPFASSIVLKHAFQPKPEALLVFATCLLIAGMLCGRGRAPVIPQPRILAVMYGVIGGFIIATKVTAAPILILPLFLLSGFAPRLIFVAVSAIAFIFFFLPAIDALSLFFDWLVKLSSTQGSHGGGPSGFVNIDEYIKAFFKILKRPSIKIPLILAAITIGLAAWRSRQSQIQLNTDDMRGIVGISAAQLAQAVLVAKQAAAVYMIPGYMLAVMSVLLSLRILWAVRPAKFDNQVSSHSIGALIVMIFIVGQINGIKKVASHFDVLRQYAEELDYKSHPQCARIYNYTSSSPVFALYLADFATGGRQSRAMKSLSPDNHYWINDWWTWKPVELRDWDGEVSFHEVRNKYPCLIFHGSKRHGAEQFLKIQKPNLLFQTTCSSGPEVIKTVGTSCKPR